MKAAFLFCFTGSPGTLYPSIPVAHALKKRGQRVIFYTWRSFRNLLQKEGFEFRPTQKLHDGDMSRPETTVWDDWKFRDPQAALNADIFGFVLKTIPDQVEDVAQIVEKDPIDVLVVDTMLYGPKLVSELKRIPWAAFWHTPYSMPSKDLPKPKVAVPKEADLEYNQIRAGYRLSSTNRPMWDHRSSPYLDLIFSTTDFEYPRSDFPAQAHLVGPSLWERPLKKLPGWLKHLPTTRPIILVSISTIYQDDLRIVKTVLKAMKNDPLTIVVTLGGTHDLEELKPLPDNTRVEQYIPHSLLLPHVNVAVLHGGHGVVLKCLSYGVPMVVIPVGRDQFAVAQRCLDAGVGIRIMPGEFSPDKIHSATQKVLEKPGYRQKAKTIQASFAKTNGPAKAADLLVKLAETHAPVLRS